MILFLGGLSFSLYLCANFCIKSALMHTNRAYCYATVVKRCELSEY